MKEYLDVRDYDGNKLGFTVERGKHQHKGWWYLCIHSYIMNDEGMLLIQQRAMTKKYFPGIWDITCGAVLAGETSLDAAIRETKEELGLDVSEFDCSFIGESHCFDCINHVYLFKGNVKLSDLSLNEDEVMAVKFISPVEMLELIKNSEFKDPEYYDMMSKFLIN